MEGHVYILINSSFPNLVKIGRTTKNPLVRAQELSSTGTPGKFVVAYSVIVNNCIDVETEMHSLFASQRHTADREFFEIDSTLAISKLIEITKDKIILKINDNLEAQQNKFATFYLIKIHNQREFYRIGILNKPSAYLSESEFKSSVIDVYTQYEPNHFYECKLIRYEEFEDVDEVSLSVMQNMIVKLKFKTK